MDESIDRIAQKVMGGNQPAPQQQAPQGQPAPQQPPQPNPKDVPTPATAQEQVAETSGPETEGDKNGDAPVTYKVKFGEGDERELTESQIRGTFERYSALNRDHAQYKPVMDMIKQLQASTKGDPQQISDFIQSAVRAQAKNPKMGQQGSDSEGQKQQTTNEGEDPIKQWELENGVSLPPKYKEMLEGQDATQKQMKQMMNMMSQVLQGAKGQGQQAQQSEQQATQERTKAIKNEIKNNLNGMAQKMGFSDDQAKDFMAFMGDRGYTFEDFVDPGLTMRVGQDFKNALNSGDFDRLKQIAEKRSAVAGSMGATPTGGGAASAGPQGEGDQAFERMLGKAEKKRMIT